MRILPKRKKSFNSEMLACTPSFCGSSCMNGCSNAACHGGDQSGALLRCSGSPGCSESDLHLSDSGVSGLPLHLRFSLDFWSEQSESQCSGSGTTELQGFVDYQP